MSLERLASLAKELGPKLEDYDYEVFLHVFPCARIHGTDINAYVDDALGSLNLIEELGEASEAVILENIRECLWYCEPKAKEGTFANESFAKLDELREEFVALLKIQLEKSDFRRDFKFLKGHPDYPVFWDFAYMILGEKDGLVLIGSSSD